MKLLRIVTVLALAGCAHKTPEVSSAPSQPTEGFAESRRPPHVAPSESSSCSDSLVAHFYDVGQGLAVLVDLPGHKHILVDTGNPANRPECGKACQDEHAHILAALQKDLGDEPINLLWVTHQHADHLGGAPDILKTFKVATLMENGRDHAKPEVKAMLAAASESGARDVIVDPAHPSPDFDSLDLGPAKLEALVPSRWPASCEHDPNQCSIVLRVSYCKASILFTGDMGGDEEASIQSIGETAVLQVGHHGSETASSAGFLGTVHPKYAVISAGSVDDPINKGYCHPRETAVSRVVASIGGQDPRRLHVFGGATCGRGAHPDLWKDVEVPETVYATERDGDVTLTLLGDGTVAEKSTRWRSASSSMNLSAIRMEAVAAPETEGRGGVPASAALRRQPTADESRLLRDRLGLVEGGANSSCKRRGVPGEFDYYLFTLSWSPQHCQHPKPDDKQQCGAGAHFGFIVHGLWPQYDKANQWPQCCAPGGTVPSDVVKEAMSVMPSPSLVQHEWEKHGTCTGASVSDYFATVQQTFDDVRIPATMQNPHDRLSLTVEQIRAAFLDANPELPEDAIAIGCEGGALSQVSLCMDKGLGLRRCGPGVVDACPSGSISVLPVP